MRMSSVLVTMVLVGVSTLGALEACGTATAGLGEGFGAIGGAVTDCAR
jgi:hypothetical protein